MGFEGPRTGSISCWMLVVGEEKSLNLFSFFACRASLDNVYFPAVTLCNINQGRRSFFLQHGLNEDGELLHSVLGQAYFGLKDNLTDEQVRLSLLQDACHGW